MNLTEAQAEDLLDKLMDLVDHRIAYALRSADEDEHYDDYLARDSLRTDVVWLLTGKGIR